MCEIACNRATGQPGNSAGSSLAKNQSYSVVAGRCATILQPSIIAGLPSAVAWSHPTAEGVPTAAKPTSSSANGAMSSASRWRDEE